MKITKRQLKRIIREEYSRLKRKGLIREMSDTSGFQFGKLQKPTSQPSADPIELAYEDGFEQGRHDAIEGMESEVSRDMFSSQEEYEAFSEGYEDGLYG